MSIRSLFLFVFISLITFSCATKPQQHINASKLLENLQILAHDSLEGRGFSRPGNYKAQQFIATQFKELGLEPYLTNTYIQKFEHTFSGKRRQRIFPISNPEKDFSNVPDTTVVGGNVIAQIKGKTDKAIVITGHLDHLGIRNGKIYNGADDDASGTAALIALADYFKDSTPKHTLIFAAVDGEESGLLGSKYFVANHTPKEAIVLNINMDMIAHNDKSELYASGLYHYPYLKPQLKGINSPLKLLFGHDDPNNKEEDDWTFSSDHGSFHRQKIPFIYFGVEDHKDYHKHTDTFENINQEFYVEAVKLIAQVIENYDSSL